MTSSERPLAKKAKSRVLIVDDHPIVRQGLVRVIEGEPDLTVCAEVADGPQALEALARSPDIAIIDISLQGRSGIDLLKDIKAHAPSLPVLVLSMHDESLYAERALRAGAKGYLMKQEATAKLLAAVRQILGGGVYMSDRVSALLVRKLAGGTAVGGGSPLEQLSDRELDVFRLVGQGLTTRDVAEKLSLSVKTVDAHREHIKTKLGLKNSTELLRYAVEHARTEA